MVVHGVLLVAADLMSILLSLHHYLHFSLVVVELAAPAVIITTFLIRLQTPVKWEGEAEGCESEEVELVVQQGVVVVVLGRNLSCLLLLLLYSMWVVVVVVVRVGEVGEVVMACLLLPPQPLLSLQQL